MKKKCYLKDLGYTKEQIQSLQNREPNTNITIVGYHTTLKSPLLKKMIENLDKDKP